MLTYWKLHKFPILLVLTSILFYYSFAFNLDRTDFIKLITLFAGAFFICYKIIQLEKWNFKFLLIAGILFRVVFLITVPNLSQDFYRFIWDGQLLANGINPYLLTPNTILEENTILISNAQELYDGMGELSAKHYSNYPPLNQLIFTISALIAGKSILGSIIVMRILVILADIGIVFFGIKLLKSLNRPTHLIFWYFLNPLVIIELTGNLHFEGVMLFFFIWSIYLISQKQWLFATILYAASIATKLVPLLFLPLFLNYFGFKKSVLFYLVVGTTTLLFFLPFFSMEFVHNFSETVGLWFSNFEFNAGFYNIVKNISIANGAKNYEVIKIYGKIAALTTISIVLIFTFFRNNEKLPTLITSMLLALSMYYFLSATVHPWYLSFLVLLSVFTTYRFAIVWSATAILSYWAYSNPSFTENLYLLFIEYLVVYAFIIYEIFDLRKRKLRFHKN
ncbi:MAG: mannosyltransferase [Cellulophaga sp.]